MACRQVYVHYNVKTADGTLLQSTWQAEGGAGLPLPFIIGAGRRAPRAWEIAFLSEQG
jgi:FKBP-type peptidyl-prolyl cis-trans isomerase 2